jgi:hypothetical protein
LAEPPWAACFQNFLRGFYGLTQFFPADLAITIPDQLRLVSKKVGRLIFTPSTDFVAGDIAAEFG